MPEMLPWARVLLPLQAELGGLREAPLAESRSNPHFSVLRDQCTCCAPGGAQFARPLPTAFQPELLKSAEGMLQLTVTTSGHPPQPGEAFI